ncbi:urease accessory protein UreF [Desulfosporosinus sp. BG]|uniref:urease accessory protein UreF n=1 Tax=Desulfosporosinus sp. BG TaxID=1633135 RepID=UPI00083A5FD0|nr:urease accessory protein UreF [Desulfosporosinus sp. BG]ODA39915.1 Urease accessory protein UreF [Desulfosporosinus sp. BG]
MIKQSTLVGLRLMQLADSAFPSGGFTQSFGLETFIQGGDIKTQQELAQFMQTFLYFTWRPTDLLAVKLAWNATKQSDLKHLYLLDRRLNAMKLPSESREGSVKMGRRLRQLLGEIDTTYQSEVNFPFGHQAIIWGHYGAGAGIELALLLTAFAHMSTASLIANGVRAIPLGQTSGQQVLALLQPLLDTCIQWATTADDKDWGGSAPAFDWAGMAHERLYSRIFMS